MEWGRRLLPILVPQLALILRIALHPGLSFRDRVMTLSVKMKVAGTMQRVDVEPADRVVWACHTELMHGHERFFPSRTR